MWYTIFIITFNEIQHKHCENKHCHTRYTIYLNYKIFQIYYQLISVHKFEVKAQKYFSCPTFYHTRPEQFLLQMHSAYNDNRQALPGQLRGKNNNFSILYILL